MSLCSCHEPLRAVLCCAVPCRAVPCCAAPCCAAPPHRLRHSVANAANPVQSSSSFSSPALSWKSSPVQFQFGLASPNCIQWLIQTLETPRVAPVSQDSMTAAGKAELAAHTAVWRAPTLQLKLAMGADPDPDPREAPRSVGHAPRRGTPRTRVPRARRGPGASTDPRSASAAPPCPARADADRARTRADHESRGGRHWCQHWQRRGRASRTRAPAADDRGATTERSGVPGRACALPRALRRAECGALPRHGASASAAARCVFGLISQAFCHLPCSPCSGSSGSPKWQWIHLLPSSVHRQFTSSDAPAAPAGAAPRGGRCALAKRPAPGGYPAAAAGAAVTGCGGKLNARRACVRAGDGPG